MAKRRSKDEAEKPFWISFADLMSALMVLFLVVMSVGLLSVTRASTSTEAAEREHQESIDRLLDQFEAAALHFPGISVSKRRSVIDFGDRARFAFNESTLTPQQEQGLREFVPEILKIANDPLGVRVLKRIVVEGFTDKTGTYLGNLALSLERSERVLCAIFESPKPDEPRLSSVQLLQVRELFMVGGYSFNAAKGTAEESRRVEMRLEFLGLGESRPEVAAQGQLGTCAL